MISMREFVVYLILMAGSTYLIRSVPFALLTGKIENRFVKSFLYYIPYAVLTAMTIPACLYATRSIISAAVGLVVAIIVALRGKSLTVVAVVACLSVFLTELIMSSMP